MVRELMVSPTEAFCVWRTGRLSVMSTVVVNSPGLSEKSTTVCC